MWDRTAHVMDSGKRMHSVVHDSTQSSSRADSSPEPADKPKGIFSKVAEKFRIWGGPKREESTASDHSWMPVDGKLADRPRKSHESCSSEEDWRVISSEASDKHPAPDLRANKLV